MAGQRGSMPASRDIVVVAASAGGLQPLRALLRSLPADLPAALFVVLHVPATGGSTLPRILDRAGPLPAGPAVDGERIRPGRVYVAPPGQHLLVVKDTVRLSHGPRQNGVRPAADPLFRSAALFAGPRVTAVVLSGTLDDAALGSATVERLGGQVVVQDPADCDYDSMPRSAISVTEHPVIVTAPAIAREVTRLATAEGDIAASAPEPDGELAAEIDGMLTASLETSTHSRRFSDLTCPECGGPLYFFGGEAQTYDCLVGHRWSPQSLYEEHSSSVERALWLAIRSLEERARLTGRLADAAHERGHELSASQFSKAAEEARQSADALRKVVRGMATEVAAESAEA
jgi:two-component system, chemotaxis family, protein-glutamate methylesterase/glutaminase